LAPIWLIPVAVGVPIAIRRLWAAPDVSLLEALTVLLVIPALAPLVALLLLALRALFAVRVHELGLRAYDFYGRRAELPWTQIYHVRPVPLLGLTYLRIATTGTERVLWIPYFLADQAAFDRLVGERAGAANPLVRAIETL
jgi:hypothetical protein